MTESRLAGGDAKAPPALSDAEYQSMTPEQRMERLEVRRAYWSKRTRRQYLEHQGITQELIDVFTDRLKGIKSWSTDGGAFLIAIHRPVQAEHYARRVKSGRGFNYGANNRNPLKAFPEEKSGAHYRGWQAVEDQDHWKKTGKTLERQHSITMDVDTPGWAFEEGFSKVEWLAVLLVALEQKTCPLPYLVEDTGGEGWHLIWTHGEPLSLETARQVQHNLWALLQWFGADADGLKIAHAFRLPHRTERQEGKPETAPRWARLSNQQTRLEDWAAVLDQEHGTTPWVRMNSEAPGGARQPLPPAAVSGNVGEAFAALADDLPDDVEGSHEQGMSLGMAFMAWAEETGLPLATAEELLRRRWPERKTKWAREYNGARTSPAPLNKWIQAHGSAQTVRLLRECGALRNPNRSMDLEHLPDPYPENPAHPVHPAQESPNRPVHEGFEVGRVCGQTLPKPCPETLQLADLAGPGLADLLHRLTWSHQVDDLTLSLLALTAVSGAVRGQAAVQVKMGWREPLNLWLGLVGHSGSAKTPVLFAVIRNGLRLVQQQVADSEMVPWPDPGRPLGIGLDGKPLQGDDPRKHRLRRCDALVDTGTIEGITRTLAVNEQRGEPLMVCPDELAAVLAGLGRHGGGAAMQHDAGRWLSIYDAKPHRHQTLSEDSVVDLRWPNCSLVGGIQPGLLACWQGNQTLVDNGFLARLILTGAPGRLLSTERPLNRKTMAVSNGSGICWTCISRAM